MLSLLLTHRIKQHYLNCGNTINKYSSFKKKKRLDYSHVAKTPQDMRMSVMPMDLGQNVKQQNGQRT